MSQAIDAPAITPLAGTVGKANFEERGARPGDWTFIIRAMDGATDIVTYTCSQELFKDQSVDLVAGGQSTYCTSDWGGPSVSVTVEPDLAVISLEATPSSLLGASTAEIAVGTQNQGTVPLGATVTLTATPPSGGAAAPVGTPQSFTLQPGESRLDNFTWSSAGLPGGTHTLTATVASSGGDTDPSDDSRTIAIPVRIRDLAISAFTTSAAAVDQGTPATLTVQIRNNGTDLDTPGTLTLTETAQGGGQRGTLTRTSPAPGTLAPGATASAIYNWDSTTAALGNHTFVAMVPPLGGETNIADNVSPLLDVRVRWHDIAVTALRAPAQAIVNCPASIAADVRNNGTDPETVTLSLSGSLAATTTNTPQGAAVNAGALSTMTFDWSPTVAGVHQLSASAAAVPGEANTANNQAAASVNVVAVVAPTVATVTPNTRQAGTPAVAITITGNNFACPALLSFRGPQSNNAVLTQVQRVDANTITAMLAISTFGPPQVVWDVIVTNPGNLSGQLTNGFTATR